MVKVRMMPIPSDVHIFEQMDAMQSISSIVGSSMSH